MTKYHVISNNGIEIRNIKTFKRENEAIRFATDISNVFKYGDMELIKKSEGEIQRYDFQKEEWFNI